MYMNYIASSKNTWNTGLTMLVNYRTVGQRMQIQTQITAKLVFWNQTYRQQQSITFDIEFCSWNRTHIFINLSCSYAIQASFAFKVGNGVRQIKRYSIIIKALYHISSKSIGVWTYFQHSLHLAALQGHTACHNKANITGA